MDDQQQPHDNQPRRWTWWWVILAVVGIVALNACIFPLMWVVEDTQGLELTRLSLGGGLVGLVVGEMCLVAVVAGLGGRSWLSGYFRGLILALLACLGILLGALTIDGIGDWTAWYTLGIACLFPWLLFLAAAPLMILRQSLRWRLAHESNRNVVPRDFRLEDLFYVVALAAAALMFLRIPQVVGFEDDAVNFWPGVIALSVVFFTVGLLALPICVWLLFRERVEFLGMVGLTAVPAIVFVAIIVPTYLGARNELPTIFWVLFGFLTGVFSVFYGTLLICKQRGTGLITGRHSAAHDAPASRLRPRLAMIGVIVTTLVISVSLEALGSWRRRRDTEIEELQQLAQSLGGQLNVAGRQYGSLTLGSKARDGDLQRFADCETTTFLDVTSTQFGDEGVRDLSLFAALTYVDLSGTAITDRGLRHLGDHEKLTILVVSETGVTGRGFADYARTDLLETIGLDRSRLNDEGCAVLTRFSRLNALHASETDVTDAAMPHLLGISQLTHLELDGTKITDAGVATLARHPTLRQLSLKGTGITEASLEHLASRKASLLLDLSDTGITDNGLRWFAQQKQVGGLVLTGTKVTGVGFRDWTSTNIGRLDLSGTSINDQTIQHLAGIGDIDYLMLHDTQLTDAALVHLAKIRISRLHVGNTAFTAKALSKLTQVGYLLVYEGQFTDNERALLRRSMQVSEVRLETD